MWYSSAHAEFFGRSYGPRCVHACCCTRAGHMTPVGGLESIALSGLHLDVWRKGHLLLGLRGTFTGKTHHTYECVSFNVKEDNEVRRPIHKNPCYTSRDVCGTTFLSQKSDRTGGTCAPEAER